MSDEETDSEGEDQDGVHALVRPTTETIYAVVRSEGEEELARPLPRLVWSGLAAGLSVGFSMVAAGVLKADLPDEDWAHPLSAFGYAAGFLIAILGRQQLFTENTITALLPVLGKRAPGARGRGVIARVRALGRLWAAVLIANLAGAMLFAAAVRWAGFIEPRYGAEFAALGQRFLEAGPGFNFASAVAAGWLVAAIVWMLPAAGQSRFVLVLFFTWLIGLLGAAHVITGSVEMFFLVFSGQASFADMFLDFTLPTLAGNIVGGSALFGLISYAQAQRAERDA